MISSYNPDASSPELLEEKATQLIAERWPRKFFVHSPVSGFHILTVLSKDPDATSNASWEKMTLVTIEIWP
jgi:hypothetical protein